MSEKDTPHPLTQTEREILTILAKGGVKIHIVRGDGNAIVGVHLDDGTVLDLETVNRMHARRWITRASREPNCYVINTKGQRVIKARL